ncbi:MAG TPA: MASE1 domain-containing protein [Candidatus Dormibacteraeota bacterium]|jgi:PAS domain S-box-containing protein|nr:MASE1 domain-containing protein [Candidatus Dormibacteraeota bacterium]
MDGATMRGSHWSDSVPGRILEVGIVAGLYYLTARLGLSLAFANKNVSTIWPPTGIALSALLLRGNRVWPGIAIGAVTANLANTAPIGLAVGISVGNTLAPIAAAYLLRRCSFHPRMDRIIDVIALAGIGAACMLISSTLGTTVLGLTGRLGSNTYLSIWSTWWVGDALGVVLFAPVLLAFASTPLRTSGIGTRPLEAAACLVATGVAGYVFLANSQPIQYLVFPLAAWAALRFLQLGATAVILVLSTISIWTTVSGLGPHPGLSSTLTLVDLELFNGTLAISALLLAAVSEERTGASLALQQSAGRLEQEIAARTKELADSNADLTKEVAVRAGAEEALRRRTGEYEGILQAISDLGEGAVVVDMSTRRIQYANDAYCRITRYRLEELQEFDSYLDVITEDARFQLERSTQAIDDGQVHSGFGEAVVLTKDGQSVPIDWASARTKIGDLERSIGIVRDATERKRKLGIVEAARDAAQAASRAKGEYLSRMSHELRTPLTVIMGYSDLLSTGDLPADDRRQVEAIMQSAEHLLALVNDVLDIARIEAGRETLKLEPIDAPSLCREAAAMMSTVAHKAGVSLSCDLDGVECTVSGDRQRLLQVLLNLISNGVKYGGGSVAVSLSPGADGTARIVVSDTGRGLSEAEQLLLFQPFQRLDAARAGTDGTGLGLALSKALVEGMGGTIGVSSSRAGTRFWVALDLASASPSPSSAAAAQEPPARQPDTGSGQTLTVLHIEDNPMMIDFVESLCSKRPDVQLHNAMLGRMGVELAQSTRPDLIVLDVHMPDVDGIEVLQRLKADSTTTDIPVVILSADATAQRITQLLDMGAAKYLTKPIRVADFFDILDAVPPRRGSSGTRPTTGAVQVARPNSDRSDSSRR